MLSLTLLALSLPLLHVQAHSAIWHPSMWGFNVTDKTYPYDNRPVVPLKNMSFDQWWFHNHLDHPPNPGDFFALPAGKPATAEIACTKGATSFFASDAGGDIRNPNNPNDPCPGSPMQTYHTNGFDTLEGCGLGITYNSDVNSVKPEDFTIFSVNHTCVWTRFTDFQVPERMPPCPAGGCICAFFWVHSPLSGGEENYMNGFRCNVTGSTSNVALATPKVARRCGADPDNQKLQAAPANCTFGAKQPFYWFNNEQNNMFEGAFSPPVYNDKYNFPDGAQNDIFQDSYIGNVPAPAPNATLPQLRTAFGGSSSSSSSGSSSSSNSTTAGTTEGNATYATPMTHDNNLPSTANATSAKSLLSDADPVSGVRATTGGTSQCGRKSTSSSSFSRRGVVEEPKGWGKLFAMSRRSRRLRRDEKGRLWHMF